MALPQNDSPWPVPGTEGITQKYAEYSALYSGGQDGSSGGVLPAKRFKGIKGTANYLWNGSVNHSDNYSDKGTETPDTAAMPLPMEMARASSNLLFSEPATISPREEDKAAQERLRLIAGPYLNSVLVGAAESCAVLGGVYLRAGSQPATNHVVVTKVEADTVVPTFSYGRLVSAQVWTTLKSTGTTVWRYVEEHSTNAFGIGVITHALYEGTVSSVGRVVPLVELTETAPLATVVDANSQVSTLTPGLSIVYIPNLTPSAIWRSDPLGCNLGRSDYEGIESLFEDYGKVHASIMRDVKHGKSHILISSDLLEDMGDGQGMGVNLDKDLLVKVGSPSASLENGNKLPMESVQFKIRTEDHLKLTDYLRKLIVSAGGYSPSTFGLDANDGAAPTATEIKSRERASYLTRDRKALLFKYGTETILTKAMAWDAALFRTGVTKHDVTVTFADAVQADPAAISAQNAQDAASNSASIATRVRRLNPGWSPKEIEDEVAAIRADQAAANGAAQAAVPPVAPVV